MSSNHAFIPASSFTPSATSSLGESSLICRLNKDKSVADKVVVTPNKNRSNVRMFSPLSGLLNLTSFFKKQDVVELPQNDKANADERAKSVKDNQELYKWDHDAIPGASMMEGIPEGENPAFGWIEDLLPILLRVGVNTAIGNSEDAAKEDEETLSSKITIAVGKLLTAITSGTFGPNIANETFNAVADIGKSKRNSDKGTIRQHKELFENIQLDVVAKGNQFLEDDIFGWYRVAGPNPMCLTKIKGKYEVQSMFPELDDSIIKGIPAFSGDSLSELLKEERLYYVSYPQFDGVQTGKDQEGKTKNCYLYSPNCLLAIPKYQVNDRVTVLPLAIRCGQDKKKYPMYTPNEKHTDPITWLAAKLTVQVADGVLHETVFHLARTHLLVGIFVCATHRALPNSHPIYRLLKCHFYGTAFINYSATTALINPGGSIDQITAPDIFVTQGVSATGINGEESKFNDWFLETDLKNRNVLDSKLPYPYRDDALLVWNAIYKWVSVYIGAYYKSDKDVVNDFELQNWCNEVTEKRKGNLHGFGDNGDGKVLTVEYLTKTIAHIIYTATAQHAAVNFPQSTLMQFAPAMPLAGYSPAPETDKPFKSIDDFSRNMFPTLDASEKQLNTAELIGVLNYSTLGDYGRNLEFAPEEVIDAMQEFKTELGIIGGKIQQRNRKEQAIGLPIYDYLVPKNIPNSINI